MKKLGSFLYLTISCFSFGNITPYKYSDLERQNGLKLYDVPLSSQIKIKRECIDEPDILCYLSVPEKRSFPIAILCGGSSNKNDVVSIIHFHRYFLNEFLDLGSAVLTIEQRGVNCQAIDIPEFIENYTRTNRLNDHVVVIDYLKRNPPKGWNGKFIFLGVSEGGPIVTSLTEMHPDVTIATINWAGAGDWSWRDELWAFIQGLKKTFPWYLKLCLFLPKNVLRFMNCYFPRTRFEFDTALNEALENPATNKEFLGMTYKYHADALIYQKCNYSKLKTPFLLVIGDLDTLVQSSDLFVEKAQNSGADVKYMKIPEMDHYIKKRPDVIEQSFKWLEDKIND